MPHTRPHLWLLLIMLALVLPACTNEVASTLTCDRLRKVRMGLSTDDVQQILGSPLDVVNASEMARRDANAEFHPD